MAKKKKPKPGPPCHHFDYRSKKQYLITEGKKKLIKKAIRNTANGR